MQCLETVTEGFFFCPTFTTSLLLASRQETQCPVLSSDVTIKRPNEGSFERERDWDGKVCGKSYFSSLLESAARVAVWRPLPYFLPVVEPPTPGQDFTLGPPPPAQMSSDSRSDWTRDTHSTKTL